MKFKNIENIIYNINKFKDNVKDKCLYLIWIPKF